MRYFAKRFIKSAVFLLLVSLLLGGYAASHAQSDQGGGGEVQTLDTAQQQPPAEAQVWTCSMHPQIQLPNPGKCPICGMDLIPLKKDSHESTEPARGMREIRLSAYAERLAEIQVHPVERKFVTSEIPMVGKIEYDETRLAYINAWVPGRIDRLYIDFTGTMVQKGAPMVYLYSPQLLSGQAELLQALRANRELQHSGLSSIKETARATVAAAREKLRLLGLTSQQVDEVVRRGTSSDHVTIMAPISGVVTHKNALEGSYVQTGTQIYTLADLSRVWVKLDAYESDLAWIEKGQSVEFQTEAYPGTIFRGTVDFIDPFLNSMTRTAKVRLNAPNGDGKLMPEMLVHATLRATLSADGKVILQPSREDQPPLVIPATAPLITGRRAIVYVAIPDRPGSYEGREIVLGPKAGDYYLVRNGLQEGEMVVTHGNFKIDSAIQILAKPSMMTPQGGGGGMTHQHGAASPKPQATGEAAAMQVPQAFREQLRGLLSAHDKIEEAIQSGELTRIREQYSRFKEALTEPDMSLLSGHPHMLWMELSMLLDNDAMVGRDARNRREAERAFRTLTQHMTRLRSEFGLDHEGHPAGPAPLQLQKPAPEAFKKQIGQLLNTYLVVQTALVDDQLDAAKQGMKALEQAAQSVDMSLLEGESHAAWMGFFANLEQAFAQLAQAEDLAALRRCFALVSEAMALVVKTFGIAPQQPVYLFRCPMAFENRGANWLQKDKETRNPYFGAAMLRCGNIIDTYSHIAATEQAGGYRHE